MPNINKVTLVGHLARKPELRYGKTGTPVISGTVAVSERRKKGDDWVDETSFVEFVAFGKRAATAMSYVTVLFYFASIVAFYAISGAVAADVLGIPEQYRLVTFGFLVIVAALGLLGVQLNARLLLILSQSKP